MCIGEPVSIISIIGTTGICTSITTTIPDTGTGNTGIVVTIGFTSIGISTGTSSGIMGAGTIIVLGTDSSVSVEWRDTRLSTGRRA